MSDAVAELLLRVDREGSEYTRPELDLEEGRACLLYEDRGAEASAEENLRTLEADDANCDPSDPAEVIVEGEVIEGEDARMAVASEGSCGF